MTLSDIKDLLAAGFTHDEIMQLNNPQNPQDFPQEQPEISPDPEEKEPIPDPIPESYPQDQPATAAPAAPAEDKLNQLTGQIDQLIRTIQASNLQNNFVDSARKADLNQQVDDIMKSIIRPEKEGGI